jgi:hypothetical protein
VMEEINYAKGKPLGPPRRYDVKGNLTDNLKAAPALFDRIRTLLRGN